MHRTLRNAGAVLAIALCPWPAAAQPTAERAAEIEIGLKGLIAEWARPFAGLVDLVFDGDIAVAPDRAGYRVWMPGGEVRAGGEVRMHYPATDWVLTPADDAQVWISRDGRRGIELPSPDGPPPGTLSVGEADWSALVDLESAWLLAFDGRWQDMVQTAEPAIRTTVDVATVSLSVSPGEAGVADVAGRLAYDNYQVTDQQLGFSSTIGQFDMDWSVSGLDVAAIRGVLRSLAALAADAPGGPPEDEEILAVLRAMLTDTPPVFTESAFTYRQQASSYAMMGFSATFADLSGGCDMHGLAADLSSGDCAFAMHGGTYALPLPGLADLLPTDGTSDIGMTDIPRSAMVDAIVAVIDTADTLGEEAAFAGAMEALGRAFADAGSEFVLRGFTMTAPAYSVSATGSLRASATSPFGIEGEMTALLGGLDDLERALDGNLMIEDPTPVLQELREFGVEDVDSAGNPVLRFAFELSPDGIARVNGTDLGLPVPVPAQ
ncbi:MAG: hypothetical protein H6842_01370 [Rhodospirillaceae bacterium]|nr:hypothetical protein [Rhodospirillaceae bacterium]